MTAIKLNILLDLVHLQPRLLYHYKIKTKHSIRKDKNPVSEVCLKKKKKAVNGEHSMIEKSERIMSVFTEIWM